MPKTLALDRWGDERDSNMRAHDIPGAELSPFVWKNPDTSLVQQFCCIMIPLKPLHLPSSCATRFFHAVLAFKAPLSRKKKKKWPNRLLFCFVVRCWGVTRSLFNRLLASSKTFFLFHRCCMYAVIPLTHIICISHIYIYEVWYKYLVFLC